MAGTAQADEKDGIIQQGYPCVLLDVSETLFHEAFCVLTALQ